jgi:hypothetical protein
MVGALLLIGFAVELFTVIDVRQMLVLHLFVGLLVVPVTLAKLASTSWRFWHYYRGDPAYRRKGPPHPLLRVLGPLVVLSSVALLGTGVSLLILGPTNDQPWRDIHQAVCVGWAVLMGVHVLGHLLETGRLATADARSAHAVAVPGVGRRRAVLAVSLLVGLGLGLGSLSWNHDWKNRPRHRDRQGVVVPGAAPRTGDQAPVA